MIDLAVFKQIILDNYSGKKGTFLASLNDESCFRTELYWELYESVAALAKQREYSEKLAAQISFVYQRMLKEMIWHFSPADSSVIANMPENYQDYIDRIDSAQWRRLPQRGSIKSLCLCSIGMKQGMLSGRRMGSRAERIWYIETKRWWKWSGSIRESRVEIR